MLRLKNPFEADKFVTEQRKLGNDVRWDTFAKTLVFFKPDPRGMFSKDGAFRNGVWGFDNRVEINDEGVLEVEYRNVRRSKNATRH